MRSRLQWVALVAIAVAASLLAAPGVRDVVLGLLPLLVLIAALTRSPDLGTERLRRWIQTRRPRIRRAARVLSARRARHGRATRRGGLLVACSLAGRAPPATAFSAV